MAPLINNIIHPKYGDIGFIAIDQTVCGRCGGGVRIFSSAATSRFQETGDLAERMTLKYGFLKVDPRGGCKIGLSIVSLEGSGRQELFFWLGAFLGDYLKNGRMSLGVDLGTCENDINCIYSGSGSGNFPDLVRHSAFYTAKGIFSVLGAIRGAMGYGDNEIRIGIEGLGKVGAEVVRFSSENNCCIVGISDKSFGLYNNKGFNSGEIYARLKREGVDSLQDYNDAGARIKPGELSALPVDILVLCADSYSIKKDNSGLIKAKAIIPAANLAIDDDVAGQLSKMGIFCVPDFIAGCGGVLGSFLLSMSLSGKEVDRVFNVWLRRRIDSYLGQPLKKNRDPIPWAKSLASKDFLEMKENYENNPMGMFLRSGLFGCIKNSRFIKRIVGSYTIGKLG